MQKYTGTVGPNYGLSVASSSVGMTGGTNRGTIAVGSSARSFSSGGFNFTGASMSIDGIRLDDLSFAGSTCTATVNGRTYTGKNINVVNGILHIDGKPVNDDEPETKADGTKVVYRVLKLEISGDVQGNVDTTSDVTVNGNIIGSVHTQSGAIRVGGHIGGNATAVSGSVRGEGDVYGNATSMSGSVRFQGKQRHDKRPPPIDLTPKKRMREEETPASAPATKKARTDAPPKASEKE